MTPTPAVPTWGEPDRSSPVRFESQRKGRRTGLVLGVGALVLAVGASVGIGWTVLGQGGGASSPEAAAQEFLEAAAAQDVLGMLDHVLPGEVAGAAEAVESQLDKLVADGDLSPGGVTEAVEARATTWEFDVDQVEETVAVVTLVDTDLEVTWNLDDLESEDLKDNMDVDDLDPDEVRGTWPNERDGDYRDLKRRVADESGISPSLVTLEDDGRWYVSLLGTFQHTVMEAGHADSDGEAAWDPANLDWGKVSEPQESVVGKDSEDVVRQALVAVEEQDLEQGLAMLPQGQVRALWASLDNVGQLIRQEADYEPGDLEVDLSHWETEERAIGDDLVEVRVTEAEFDAVYTDPDSYDEYDSSERATFGFRDGCFFSEVDGYEDSECMGDSAELRDFFADEELVMILREVDGGLQFDPLATAMHYLAKAEVNGLVVG